MKGMKKKVHPVFLFLSVFIVIVLVAVAVSGNQAGEEESAIDEYNKDSTSLIVSNGGKDKMNTYQKDFDESKRPKNTEYVTPDFKIEESNLADKTEKKAEEPEKEKKTDGQVSGSYNSPYEKSNNTTAKETEKKTTPKEEEEESLFNISTRQGSNSGGKYKAVIHNDQKIRDGGAVRIRLQEDAVVKGKTVPRNTIFYGTLSSSGNGRLQISITQFKEVSGSATVLDTDYQPGIKYDQATESGVVTEGKSIGRQITSDLLSRLPAGRYASSLVRSARSSDGSIYLVDGYKIIIAVN